jgi:transposase-like protein
MDIMAKFTIDQAVICKLYADGLSATEIGIRYSVSKCPILRVLHESGIVMRRPNIIEGKYEKSEITVRLYQEGKSIHEIMAITGVGRNNTSMFLRNAGIAVRSTKDYENGWCKKLHIDTTDVVRRYKAGATVSDLATDLHVGFGTILRALASSGTTMRKNSWDRFHDIFPEMVRLYINEKKSIKLVSVILGVNSATVLRYLKNGGIEVRADSSVPVYLHESPFAGEVCVRGTWELSYAKILDIWALSGAIKSWEYESEKIDTKRFGIGDHYIPDFSVVQNTGKIVLHEVKGFFRDHSRKKFNAVRNSGRDIVLVRGALLKAYCDQYGIDIGI